MLVSALSDQEVIARTAYGECRGGGVTGMKSVINVIQNRANKPGWWGSTMREVCLKPYQFSTWLPSDPNYNVISHASEFDATYTASMELAQQAINGTLEDITKGSTYYLADSLKIWPHWATGHTPATIIAHQYFFNSIT